LRWHMANSCLSCFDPETSRGTLISIREGRGLLPHGVVYRVGPGPRRRGLRHTYLRAQMP
jgi:hypothetical protein